MDAKNRQDSVAFKHSVWIQIRAVAIKVVLAKLIKYGEEATGLEIRIVRN